MKEGLFESFVRAMGFNKKQIATAGEYIGLTKTGAHRRSQGIIAVSEAEALAMTAAFLSLPAWRQEFADLPPKQRKRVMRAAKLIRAALAGEEPQRKAA